MKILTVDTSTKKGSLCIASTSPSRAAPRILAKRLWDKKSTHSDVVTLNLEEALNEAKLTIEDLDALGVVNGPGSFTGVRVAINLVRTLAYGLKKPIFSFNAFEAMAYPFLEPHQSVICAVPAFRNLIYVCGFAGSFEKTIIESSALDPQAVEELMQKYPHSLFIGESWPNILDKGREINCKKGPDNLAALIPEIMLNLGRAPVSWNELKPLYIRASEPEEKLKSGILKPLAK